MKNFFLLLFVFQCSVLLAQPEQGDSLAAGPRDEVFTVVETMPQFPGGERAMMQYIAEHIEYPPLAKENNIQGRVLINFVIDQEGNVTNVTIMKDIGYGCGAEAARVVKSMPRWKPGTQKGKPVKVRYVLPISFKLEGPAPKKKKKKKSQSGADERFVIPNNQRKQFCSRLPL